MKVALLAALGSAALAGCASTGQLSPPAQTAVTGAFNAVCPGVSSGALDALIATENQNVQNSYAAAEQICAAGAPTNLVVAGLDLVTLQSVLAPYLAKVRVSAKGVGIK